MVVVESDFSCCYFAILCRVFGGVRPCGSIGSCEESIVVSRSDGSDSMVASLCKGSD